jgi:poly(A) polymerase
MKLPAASWRARVGLDALIDALGGAATTRFVGGAVRDSLLGIEVKDVDAATRLLPESAVERIKAAGFQAVPTGIAHGTVTAILPGGPVEITTLRRDVSTDGRRASVAFTDDWREDAARRDFTINALFADPLTGEIHDYFDGLTDLEARRVRFIGDPLRRIAEDHLRILRFFRFLARFGDQPDPEGLEACTARARDLMALSRERIADELLKLLVTRDAVRIVRLMQQRAIFAPVLPEIDAAGVERLQELALREAGCGIKPDALRRLAALLPGDSALGDRVGARLKLSNAQRKRLASALGGTDAGPVEELAYRLGREGAIDRLLLASLPVDESCALYQRLMQWPVPRLPLSGGNLVARGLAKGPEVARSLRAIEERWIAEGFPPAERVEQIADEWVDQLLRERQ